MSCRKPSPEAGDNRLIGSTGIRHPSASVTRLRVGHPSGDDPAGIRPIVEATLDEPYFDTEGVFDEDYLYFYFSDEQAADARAWSEVDLIWRLLDLAPSRRVLDLACGHGRIANRLAQRGCRVTGLDATPLFLDRARRDATALGVDVEYVRGDMRELPWRAEFDAALSWFTAFGYFDDDGNRRVLEQLAGAVQPGGRVLMELNNMAWLWRNYDPGRILQLGEDMMVDQTTADLRSGRIETKRTLVRDGRLRHTSFVVRLYTFTELRDWLLRAGFSTVDGYGDEGGALTLDSRRMIIVATR
jgi:SAM-dependent methyltransferase